MGDKKKCKYCKSEIDKKAKICPMCRKKQGNKTPIIIIVIIILFIIIATSGGNNTTAPSENSTGNSNVNNQVQEKFTLQEGHKGYSDEFGLGYYIEGSIQNNTDKVYSYVQVTFNLYDSEGAQVGSALANVNNLEGKGVWKFKAIGSLGDAEKVASYKLIEITGW